MPRACPSVPRPQEDLRACCLHVGTVDSAYDTCRTAPFPWGQTAQGWTFLWVAPKPEQQAHAPRAPALFLMSFMGRNMKVLKQKILALLHSWHRR